MTTNLWKLDAQTTEYVVITVHWVDQEWTLHKRIIGFVHVPLSRKGKNVVQAMFNI